jgi:DNA-directed RNA polymerase subunit beta'
MAFHDARRVKERMDEEERRAIAEADAASLAADQEAQASSDLSAE